MFCLVRYYGSKKNSVTGSALPAGLRRLLLTPEIAETTDGISVLKGDCPLIRGQPIVTQMEEKIMARSKQRRYDSGNLPERSGKGHSSVRKTTEPINKR